MAKLPTTLGDNPTPTPQRRVRGYDSQQYARAQIETANDGMRAAKEREAKVEKDAILEAQDRENQAKRKVLDLLYGSGDTPGLYSAKGADALKSSETFEKRYKEITEQTMDGVNNPLARKALQRQLDDIGLNNLDNVKRYEMQERTGYATSLAGASADLAQERVGLEWNNDKTADEALKSAESSAIATAKLKGYAQGDAAWTETVRGAKSKVLTTRLTSMLNQNDPAIIAEAGRKYEAYRKDGSMTFDDVNKLDTQFDAALPRAKAYESFGKFKGAQVLGSLPQGKTFNAMLQVESGGRQLDDKGNPITSPKGAIGIAQIMPDTGPDAAKLAGVAWDEKRFKTDEAYNRQLGEAYYNHLEAKYKDPSLAALAYNWGMGNVDEHIAEVGDPRTGKTSMDYFLATVPSKEARQYVPKVQAAAGIGGMGVIDTDVATSYASSMPDPKERDEFLKLVEQQNKAMSAQRDADVKQTMDDALTAFRGGGNTWDSVPTPIRAKAMQLGLYDKISQYKGTSDPSVVSFLYSLPADQLSKTDLNTPDVRLGLSEDDYKKWETKKQALSNPAVAVTENVRTAMVKQALQSRGFAYSDQGTGKKAVEAQKRITNVNAQIDLAVDAYAQNNGGKYPDGAGMQKIVDEVFVKRDYDVSPGSNDYPWNWGGKRPYLFDVSVDDIPAKERQSIEKALKDKGLPASDQAIVRRWVLADGTTK